MCTAPTARLLVGEVRVLGNHLAGGRGPAHGDLPPGAVPRRCRRPLGAQGQGRQPSKGGPEQGGRWAAEHHWCGGREGVWAGVEGGYSVLRGCPAAEKGISTLFLLPPSSDPLPSPPHSG